MNLVSVISIWEGKATCEELPGSMTGFEYWPGVIRYETEKFSYAERPPPPRMQLFFTTLYFFIFLNALPGFLTVHCQIILLSGTARLVYAAA